MIRSLTFKNYHRQLQRIIVTKNVGKTRCMFHCKKKKYRTQYVSPYCGIINDPLQRTERIYVYGWENNFDDNIKLDLCPISRKTVNLVTEFSRSKIGKGDYVKTDCNAIRIGKNKNYFISLKHLLTLNSLSLKNPSLGPSDLRDAVLFAHQEHIRHDLCSNYPNIEYTENELKKFAASFVLDTYQYIMIYQMLYDKIWKPTYLRWKLITMKMGGDVVCIDWTWNVIKLLYMTSDVYTNKNVEELLEEVDKREYQGHAKCNVFNMQNRYAYCCNVNMCPNASEADLFVIPHIANYYVGCCILSEKTCNGLQIKHDGLDTKKYLGIKVADSIIQHHGEIINGYNIPQMMPRFEVYIYIYFHFFIHILYTIYIYIYIYTVITR